MLRRMSRFLWLAAVVWQAGAAFSSAPKPMRTDGPLQIDGLGKGAVPLDGLWQFHLGDDPAWAAPGLDDSGWEQLAGNLPWGEQGHANYTGFAWYRRNISITPAAGVAAEFSLLLPRVDDAYEIYWNGKLVGRNGKLPPYPVWYYSQPPQVFSLGPVGSGVVAVRVWKAPLLSDDSGQTGGFEATPIVGSPEAIAAERGALEYQWMRSRQFLFSLHLLYGLVALLSFMAWWRNRGDRLLFWMTGFAIAPLLMLLLLDSHIRWPYVLAMGISQPLSSIRDISLWFLLLWLLHLRENRNLLRLTRILAAISLAVNTLDGLILAISWSPRLIGPARAADAAIAIIDTLIEALPLVLVGFAIAHRKRLDLASWVVAAFAFLMEMIEVVRNASQQGQQFTHWTLADTISAPLFEINGSLVSVPRLIEVLLLISIVYAVYRSFQEDRRRQTVLEQEFHNARELQRVLIPETEQALPGYSLTSAYLPAQEVGGDFFQIVPLEGDNAGSTLVVLGDVSGKGLKAAMSVSLIVGAVRALANFAPSPAQLLGELNRRLHGRLQGGFATCLALRLDPHGNCIASSAGHPAPFLNRRELELPGALPLGLVSIASYEETSIQLMEGDRLTLYTDGLLEARSRNGELYGFERLRSLFATMPSAALATEAAVEFGQDDDVTVLTLTRAAGGAESPALDAAGLAGG